MGTSIRHGGTDLGRRICAHRRWAGLTLDEVAARAGMATSYLEYLETNPMASPTPACLVRLAAALGTSPRVLAGAGLELPPSQQPPSAPHLPQLETLDLAECRAYLGLGGVGRFIFVEERGPVAVPVNYRMLGDDVVFRTTAWAESTTRSGQRRVSFEVDRIDEALGEGWSVLVSGRAHVVSEPAELAEVTALGVQPWAAGERDTYIRLVPTEISGRRIRGA